jgi:hypothetical protein
MKRLINLIAKLFASKKSVVISEDPEPNANPKKEIWKFILQTVISILTAILTALGASSCVHHIM